MQMQIDYSGLTFSRTRMLFGFFPMFLMTSFDRYKMFSILLFTDDLHANVSALVALIG